MISPSLAKDLITYSGKVSEPIASYQSLDFINHLCAKHPIESLDIFLEVPKIV